MGLTIHPRRRHLYLAVESTAGTYAGNATLFVVGDETLPVESLKWDGKVAFTKREIDGSSLQDINSVPGAQMGTMGFQTRLIGPASKGVAGPLTPLLKALGLSETLVATTSATYVEDPTVMTTLSVGWGILREDGTIEVERALAGARVSKLTIKADGSGKPFLCMWELTGKIAYVSTAPVELDNATPNNGVTYVDDNANGFRMIGMTVRSGLLSRQISKFEFDVGRKVELGTDIGDLSGYDYAHVASTAPVLKIDPSKVSVATAADLLNFINGQSASAAFTATSPNGGLFTWSSANLQPVTEGDGKQGTAIDAWDITAECHRSQTGAALDKSDAWTIIFA